MKLLLLGGPDGPDGEEQWRCDRESLGEVEFLGGVEVFLAEWAA